MSSIWKRQRHIDGWYWGSHHFNRFSPGIFRRTCFSQSIAEKSLKSQATPNLGLARLLIIYIWYIIYIYIYVIIYSTRNPHVFFVFVNAPSWPLWNHQRRTLRRPHRGGAASQASPPRPMHHENPSTKLGWFEVYNSLVQFVSSKDKLLYKPINYNYIPHKHHKS